jgi:rod shape-determining protein MreC
MPQFFLNKRLILLLVSIIVLVALIGYSLKDQKRLTWPEQFVKDTSGWVQSMFHRPAQYVSGFFEDVSDVKNTYEQNKQLKAHLDKYMSVETELQDLKKENKELRAILNKKESLRNFTSIQATIIARNPDHWHEYITLNKGQIHGVKDNMAVITAKGLIGKIKSTSQFTSTVQLLSALDRKNRISAVIQGKEDVYGLIEGYDEDKEALLFKRIPTKAEIKVGQNVETSGLGGVFPKGLVIGRVTKVVPDQYGLTQMAYVKPAAHFYDIDDVIVVERKMISEDQQNQQKVGDE